MDSKTEGAWLLSHGKKVNSLSGVNDCSAISFSSKCGELLSSISSDDELIINEDKLRTYAKIHSINIYGELPEVIRKLVENKLIDKSGGDYRILGLTSASTLSHTSAIFKSLNPAKLECAYLEIADQASDTPKLIHKLKEEVGDRLQLSSKEMNLITDNAISYEFVDCEKTSGDQYIFNGNIFRSNDAKKISYIIDSLNAEDSKKLNEYLILLRSSGCLELSLSKKMLPDSLLSKLSQVGFFDISTVKNSSESCSYITLPSAFKKFNSGFVDDAFDNAKTLVASLTYGMQKSSHSRGQISSLPLLLEKLIQGRWVGPSTAIGQDYKLLELKGVLKLKPEQKYGTVLYSMKLLKKEIGQMALDILTTGQFSRPTQNEKVEIPDFNCDVYIGPETNRIERKKLNKEQGKSIEDIINVLRQS